MNYVQQISPSIYVAKKKNNREHKHSPKRQANPRLNAWSTYTGQRTTNRKDKEGEREVRPNQRLNGREEGKRTRAKLIPAPQRTGWSTPRLLPGTQGKKERKKRRRRRTRERENQKHKRSPRHQANQQLNAWWLTRGQPTRNREIPRNARRTHRLTLGD